MRESSNSQKVSVPLVQWQIQDFPDGGRNTKLGRQPIIFGQFSRKCMKMSNDNWVDWGGVTFPNSSNTVVT